MRKFLFSFAIVLLGASAALADSAPNSVIMDQHGVVRETYAQALTTGDSAPSVKIVKRPSIDYSSTAAIQAPHNGVNFNSRDGDAAPPLR